MSQSFARIINSDSFYPSADECVSSVDGFKLLYAFIAIFSFLCTPVTGVNLWGDLSAYTAQAGSPLYVNPVNKSSDLLAQVLAEGKGVAARRGLKKARVQSDEPANPAYSGTQALNGI